MEAKFESNKVKWMFENRLIKFKEPFLWLMEAILFREGGMGRVF